jgi:hypothetical protein
MPSPANINSGTGQAPLPDVGTLSYNGVQFSCLYKSHVEGKQILDEANRTVKWIEYTLTVDGLVTLPAGWGPLTTTDSVWQQLRLLLQQQAQPLVYKGNGFGGVQVNVPGQQQFDVNWGPIPKLLGFQPLGSGRAAQIQWQATFCLAEIPSANTIGPLAQLNYEVTLTYDEQGYAGLNIHGTLQIASSRNLGIAGQPLRTLSTTVDAYRQQFLDVKVDLTHYRITRRSFHYSRDKATCEWEFQAEQMAKMGMPVGMMDARGSMSVRPYKIGGQGSGILAGMSWLVNLRATYWVREDQDPLLAVQAFYALLWYRMQCSREGVFPGLRANDNAEQQFNPITITLQIGKTIAGLLPSKPKAMLTHFGYDEGLYLDSKQISFEAAWLLLVDFQSIMKATGVWNRVVVGGFMGVPQVGDHSSVAANNWSTSVQNVMGWRSFLQAALDPTMDVIVDFGTTTPGVTPFQPVQAF